MTGLVALCLMSSIQPLDLIRDHLLSLPDKLTAIIQAEEITTCRQLDRFIGGLPVVPTIGINNFLLVLVDNIIIYLTLVLPLEFIDL